MHTIDNLRSKIEKVDMQIIKKLAQRKTLSLKIGKIKSKICKKIVDKKREEKLIAFYEKLSLEYQLDPYFVKKLFKLIFINSKKLQKLNKLT